MSTATILEQLGERIRRMAEDDRRKLGGMTLGAMGRLGLAEVRQAASLDGSVADQTQTPLGMYGTLTPGEVSSARQEDGTVHGPAGKEGVEGEADWTRDPVEAARRQASATTSAERPPAGKDRS